MYDDVMVSYGCVSMFSSLEIAVFLAIVWSIIFGPKSFWMQSLEDLQFSVYMNL